MFLDRDGVVSAAIVRDGKPFSPHTVDELAILPGVPDALRELAGAGYALVVVTNQPDVGRGKQPRETVDAMHARLREALPLDAIYCCFHDDADRCHCRKPAPGMLLDAARDLDLDLTRSYMIGDRWRDMEAGAAAGCRTIFVDYGYAERQPRSFDHKVTSLPEAASWILSGAMK